MIDMRSQFVVYKRTEERFRVMVNNRHGGLMVSALYSGSNGLGSSPGPGHCVVFLGKTRFSCTALSTQVYKWVPANLMLE